jgi:RNA polymerase sigma factor (sigma-70 family)
LIDYTDIINKCKKNNRQAQAQLYNSLAPKLLGICTRYIKERSEAEDVMQDSIVKIFLKLDSFKHQGSFEGWARRITVNTALSHLRADNKMQFNRDLKIIENIEFKSEEISLVDEKDLLVCLDSLPMGYRTIINLFLIEDYSHKEVAEKLGISESTSRSQLSRARQTLAELLKQRIKDQESKYA